ncbi:O-antigen ligase family protein [Prochlorococcus sp. MIT 1223]|uniref:O-antigen ligase family protein n=1 Tax=Prochlorococcus sp. MIT 1223 TaxID=3096217 RepID=UPI002A76065B|nr:O-antigen ligase family protein [Prochlorococcus sp. MIT 1223]
MIKIDRAHIVQSLSTNRVGSYFFQFGLFLLPSSALLGSIFLLSSSFIKPCHREISFWEDKWNYLLISTALLMIIGCFHAYSGTLAWLGLANWIPLFWCFWGFQPYLRTPDLRRRSAYCLILGTVPLLITGFGELWLGWDGPWQTFNGLIIWFISAGGEPEGRLSGLFEHANYAAAWLVVVWPLSLAALIQPFLNLRKRSFVFCFVMAVFIALVMTDSRNGWGGLIFAIPFVLGPINWTWFLPLFFIILLPIALAVLPGIDTGLQELARKIVPKHLWSRLNDMRFVDSRPIEGTRLAQWNVAFGLIKDKPWFGWGAAAFSVLYPIRKGLWHGHAHNLPIELAVSHGLLVSISIVGMVASLLIIALLRGVLVVNQNRNIDNDNLSFDRAWWTSTFLLVCFHGTDMPFFDSRINLVGWVLLAGLRSLIYSQKLESRNRA